MSFWSTYAVHVQASFGLGAAAAGLFGFAGVAGIGCAGLVGGQVDRGRFLLVSITGSMLMVLGFGLLAIGNSILLTAVGALLLDGGAMATHAANQSKALALRPEAVARTNSVYIAIYFIGGAVGTIVSGIVMARFGWLATCAVGAGFPIVVVSSETIRSLFVEKQDLLRRESGRAEGGG
jgi:predicted MFS family arabinose efflux permease